MGLGRLTSIKANKSRCFTLAKLPQMLTSFLFGFLRFSIATRATEPDTLHITAIVGKHDVSQVECWSLLPGYAVSSQVRPINFSS